MQRAASTKRETSTHVAKMPLLNVIESSNSATQWLTNATVLSGHHSGTPLFPVF